MTPKTTPVSVRLTPQDQEFLASLEIDEAKTPSEKIRALIKQAQLPQKESARQLLEPKLALIKEQMLEEDIHSEVFGIVGDWLLEVLTLFSLQEKNLSKLERQLVQRVFRLNVAMLRMGMTQQAPCHDPGIINEFIPQIREVMKVIEERINKETN